MTMTHNDNNGGRIAYASKAAAQLLGLGSPNKPRSAQMNHPITLKFSSNKQPLFPNRSQTMSYNRNLSNRSSYSNINNNTQSSRSSMQSNPLIVRPHSSNEFNTIDNNMNINTNNHNNRNVYNNHNTNSSNHIIRPNSLPNSLPVTPNINFNSSINASNQYNHNGSHQINKSPNRGQMRIRNQYKQQNTSYDSYRHHQQQLVHPRSAHSVHSLPASSPIKAMPNKNILQNIPNKNNQNQHHQQHQLHQPKQPTLNRLKTTPILSLNHLNSKQAPKLRRHSTASHHQIQQQHQRPHSYSPNVDSNNSNNPFLNTAGTASNIRVVVRIRPLSEQEQRDKCSYCIGLTQDQNPNSIFIQQFNKKDGSIKKEKTFTFDKICHADTQQSHFFDSCGVKQLIDASLNGYATTIFAYGQTGSGKTYSVCGDNQFNNNQVDQLSGIIPRTIMDLWNKISSNNNNNNRQYVIRAGYLEIYNERPRDLLNPHFKNLSIRWNSESGFFVENQCIVRCESAQDLFAVFNEGESNRERGSHELNTKSSRSHCLFTIHIELKQFMDNDGGNDCYIQNGKISIVDLAGSEKLKASKQQSDKGLRETANINRSLFTLGKVISTLERVQSKELPSSTYIPYRDSVLTKLLMDSLGGSGMAIMIACVSPANIYIDETLSTLYYASRARNIKNVPTKKINAKDRIIAQLLQEIQRLKSDNLKMKQYISTMGNNPNKQQTQLSHNSVPQHSNQQRFSWEMNNGSSSSHNSRPNSNSNSNSSSRYHLHQQQPYHLQQQQRMQQSLHLSLPTNKPPLLYTPSSSPHYGHNQQQQQQQQQGVEEPLSPQVKNAFASLQLAKQSAEQEANYAKQENYKLLDKIEHLERVFVHNQ